MPILSHLIVCFFACIDFLLDGQLDLVIESQVGLVCADFDDTLLVDKRELHCRHVLNAVGMVANLPWLDRCRNGYFDIAVRVPGHCHEGVAQVVVNVQPFVPLLDAESGGRVRPNMFQNLEYFNVLALDGDLMFFVLHVQVMRGLSAMAAFQLLVHFVLLKQQLFEEDDLLFGTQIDLQLII